MPLGMNDLLSHTERPRPPAKTKDATPTTPFQPTAKRVLIERIKSEPLTKGGIALPDTAQEKINRGTAVAIGSKVDPLYQGACVVFNPYGAQVLTDDSGQEYLLLHHKDILATMPNNSKEN